MHLTPEAKEEMGLAEYEGLEALAAKIADETLNAYVFAIKEVLTTPTRKNTRRMVILAVHAVKRVSCKLPIKDDRFLYFDSLKNRLSRILDGGLRRAVENRDWAEAHSQRRDVYATIVDAIVNYPR